VCDFNTGFVPPEMVKRRPVIAVSKNRNDSVKVCSVIPISSTKPDIIRDYHYLLPQHEMPKYCKAKFPESWIKIDMIQTVSFSRLTLPWDGRSHDGRRRYETRPISGEHRLAIAEKLYLYLSLSILDSAK